MQVGRRVGGGWAPPLQNLVSGSAVGCDTFTWVEAPSRDTQADTEVPAPLGSSLGHIFSVFPCTRT